MLAGTSTRTTPTVVVARSVNAVRIQALDERAQALGLHVGLGLADARARHPDIAVVDADDPADAAALKGLAEACRRYTPTVTLDPPDGLFLDVTGCAHLWGGEAALLADLTARVEGAGYACRAALADTAGLAWALVRWGEGGVIAPGEREGPLAPLPIAALRLPGEIVEALARVGLKRVGQLLDTPRAPLARRFGAEVLSRLDQALGLKGEARTAEPEALPWRADRRLFDPVSSEADVLGIALGLAEALSRRLEAEGKGGRLFGLELFRLDGAVKRLKVACARPLRDPKRIAALFAERLATLNEGLEADYGFDLLRLWALKVEPLAAEALRLDGEANGAHAVEALADRLSVRLGPKAVTRAVPCDAWRPEDAVAMVGVGEGPAAPWAAETPAAYAGAPLRPVRLFAAPEPLEAMAEAPDGPPARFTWRRLARRVVRAEGPERISGDWRDPNDGGDRDYWRVEDEGGRRYWLFRQGLYAPEQDPRWFLHGLFA